MAIYEYGCKKCGEKFELIRRVAKRDDAAACPQCGSKTPKRIEIQRVAVITGVAPDIMAGDGDPEDFGYGGDDDFGGLDMDDF
ncbi:MAG: zinc ribbon domain-containing protein [Dehalococcoidia bacterium]|nr:zinc ribbon domain-containing protein [Dehalococcoidia bacterium]